MRRPHVSQHPPGDLLPIHRHSVPYAAVVLAGHYREVGPDGVWACAEGDVVVHPPFHLHGDHFAAEGARVLNLEVSFPHARTVGMDCYAVVRPPDLGRLLRTASKDPLLALGEALEAARPPRPGPASDWLHTLIQRLDAEPRAKIGALAREVGVSAEHVSRAFIRRLGIGPAHVRSEHRVRIALRHLADPDRPLADVAQRAGYVDQAHMTRAIQAATGTTPGRVRKQLIFNRA